MAHPAKLSHWKGSAILFLNIGWEDNSFVTPRHLRAPCRHRCPEWKARPGRTNDVSNQAIRLWGGRFRKPPSAALMALSSAATQHARLVPYDILGSIAHAGALHASGVISGSDRATIVETLIGIRQDVLAGTLAPESFDEDIHTFLERVLIERIGATGAKLRAGRSRNDQAANDLKLYLRAEALVLVERLAGLAEAIARRAEAHDDAPCPGFTHLQIAQPVTFGHLLMAHAQPLARDIERLRDWHARAAECPLGAAALAGTAFPGKPGETARLLGYERPAENSIDAVGARDHVAEFLFVTAMIATNISRLSEEITLWASRQFGWINLDDSFATGSSIMPQKKNPDIAEIARGRAARLIGDLVTMLTALKGLPLAYNRDLAEDKRAAFDACDVLEQVVPALRGLVETMQIETARLAADAAEGFALATEPADYLAANGVPFAEAHEISGALVRRAEELGLRLDALGAEDLARVDPRLGADLLPRLKPEFAIAARTGAGGTAPVRVREQIARFRERLSRHRAWAEEKIAETHHA
ncbi:MAG: argininosuccinate lyase [Methylobacterium sp.]|nr:MAG: argininosuccinate lyase [Methylobacterium sp.]